MSRVLMPVVLAMFVVFLTGFAPSAGSSSIRSGDARELVSGRIAGPFLASACQPAASDRFSSIAIILEARERTEAIREIEEEESEDNHFGRSLASALILPSLWNGPSAHARPAPDPSRLPRPRALFLLCGHLLC